jgi:cytochrome c oxidase assembly factor CtaG
VVVNVAWWCSGTPGQVWTWRYTPFLGVWIVVAALLGGYVRAHRRAGRPLDPVRLRRWIAGVAAIAIVSEWPIGALGAGYFASLGIVRYIGITFVAAPLLIGGIPSWLLDHWLPQGSVRWSIVRALTRWPVALLLFNVVLFGTHVPGIVDSLKVYQLGSFAVDAAHLIAALAWWFPAMRREPERGALREPVRGFYLFASSMLMFIPASFLTFSPLPLYGLYELAPPLWLGFDPLRDQQLAGVMMNVVGGFVLWTVIAIGFMRWAKAEERADEDVRRERYGSGATVGES